MDVVSAVAQELTLPLEHVRNALRLLDEDNTIPFVARYRKEQTGSLDEVQLRMLRDRAQYLRELQERREAVLASIAAQGKLTEPLRAAILAASAKQALEDLYLPYRPKRRTRASMARDKGLEPLALRLFVELPPPAHPEAEVSAFVASLQTPLPADEAWAGCRDILAERVADDAATRAAVRQMTFERGEIVSNVQPELAGQRSKFSDYYDFREPLGRIPAHRYLALRRGEGEQVLRVSVAAPVADVLAMLAVRWRGAASGRLGEEWARILDDAYSRLIAPAVEVDLRVALKEAADRASIAMFAQNLRSLLLAPYGGQKVALGLDPGFRTGSKWAVVDGTGRLREHGTIYPLPPQRETQAAADALAAAVHEHGVEVLAIGNGTASRELLSFVRGLVAERKLALQVLLVNESGASVYSASDLARQELPGLDLTFRGAVSIARRYQDPLAELVKIDPKAIGVGQYQHDVNQHALRDSLRDTVESCVNHVGVNLNTASPALLRYVSGISESRAAEIVRHRDAHGPFASRAALLAVSGVGAKSFQQCAGFLRLPGGGEPLDNSAVHPEHYGLVSRLAADLGVSVGELIGRAALLERIDPRRYVTDEVGLPTLTDILDELRKPGRDPRDMAAAVEFDEQVTTLADLRPGMRLNGIVTNLTHFGAFVDIGVHQDGLVHISEMAERYVASPSDVVRVGQAVRVHVLSVDADRRRIALSLKAIPGAAVAAAPAATTRSAAARKTPAGAQGLQGAAHGKRGASRSEPGRNRRSGEEPRSMGGEALRQALHGLNIDSER